MDFQKKLLISGSVLGGLIVLFVIGSIAAAVNLAPRGEILFPTFKGGFVVKVSVSDSKGSIEIKKETDETWLVHNNGKTFQPDQIVVAMLLKNVTDLRKTKIASLNPETWTNFNVDEKDAVHYVFTEADGTVSVDCYFGKGGPTSMSQFIRLAGSNEVLQTDYRIEHTAALKDWIELKLFTDTIPVEDVQSITVTSRSSFVQGQGGIDEVPRSFSLALIASGEKKDDKLVWSVRGNVNIPLSSDKVTGYITTFAGFTAQDVVTDPETAGLNPGTVPRGSVTLQVASGASYTLYLFQSVPGNDTLYYVTNHDKKYFYVHEDWTLRNLFKGVEGFVDEAALLTR